MDRQCSPAGEAKPTVIDDPESVNVRGGPLGGGIDRPSPGPLIMPALWTIVISFPGSARKCVRSHSLRSSPPTTDGIFPECCPTWRPAERRTRPSAVCDVVQQSLLTYPRPCFAAVELMSASVFIISTGDFSLGLASARRRYRWRAGTDYGTQRSDREAF